jgi:hypothetical protein
MYAHACGRRSLCGMPASARFEMKAICTSEDFDLFIAHSSSGPKPKLEFSGLKWSRKREAGQGRT